MTLLLCVFVFFFTSAFFFLKSTSHLFYFQSNGDIARKDLATYGMSSLKIFPSIPSSNIRPRNCKSSISSHPHNCRLNRFCKLNVIKHKVKKIRFIVAIAILKLLWRRNDFFFFITGSNLLLMLSHGVRAGSSRARRGLGWHS